MIWSNITESGVSKLVLFLGLLHPGTEDATWAVIFEASPEHPHAVGEQRRGGSVAFETFIAPAVEMKHDPPLTVDPPAVGQPESLAHAFGPSCGA